MRPHRSSSLLLRVLLPVAAAAGLHAQTLISLGATSGTGSGCSLSAGGTCTLTARVTGIADTRVTFNFNPTVSGATIGTPQGPDATGLTTITYKAPSPVASRQTVTASATASDGTTATPVTITLNPPSLGVQVSPSSATLSQGQSATFTATVTGVSNTAVTWSINPQTGTLRSNGNTATYAAPASLNGSSKVTLTATSVFDPTSTGTASITLNQQIDVGGGAPTDAIRAAFQAGWNRNGFNALVENPPLGNVRAFGTSGYVQEFTDAANNSLKDALVTLAAAKGGTAGVAQIMGPLYAYYSSVSANTAGYPLDDSQPCSAQGISCLWDLFDKNYALFAFTAPVLSNASTFAVNGTFYTEWTALGAMNTFGPPVSAQTAGVAAATIIPPATAATVATVQTFDKGAIYSITSAGPNRGKIFSVLGPIYLKYLDQQGPQGPLGMPASEQFQIAATTFKQNFEGGALQYTIGGDPTVVLPVASVALAGAQGGSTITLNLGQSVSVTATPMLLGGVEATDRPVSWSTSNNKVVAIDATGGTAVLKAVGGGAAYVQAASNGVTSARINFIVISPCCQVGDGAPAAVARAFLDALARNKITVQTPVAAPASRVGGGYIQMASAADSNAAYLLALSDRLGTAYVVTGALLPRYQALGGPSGILGYPAGDATSGGTQLFANAALGGNPVRTVSAPVLARWALLGYDGGAAGLPVGDAAPFATLGANAGAQQMFSKGLIVAAATGPRAGEGHLVSGLILARYSALGGAAGDFGMPTSDEFASGAQRQQNFEGGNITYGSGDAAAVEHPAGRAPGVIVSPGTVSAGARARLAVLGFPNDSTLQVSVTGSPDFVVTTKNGAYSWDMAIPLSAKSGSLSIHASDGKGASADGSLVIKGFDGNRIQITKLQGDNQTGLPGSVLPLSLRVGLPVAGATVTFEASNGVQLSAPSAITDADGQAEVFVRLPAAAGVAAVTANAAPIAQAPVTFFVRAAASSFTNFPQFPQSADAVLGNGKATIAQKGALVTAAASILAYHQGRKELAMPNGPADPAALNQFLKAYCTVDTKGAQVCDGFLAASGGDQMANLWRAAEFTGGVDVVAVNPAAQAVPDLLAQGSPVLLSLALARNGAAAGGHFVVATGVAADGSIVIQDPNPFFARANLGDYLRGFAIGGATWTAEVRGAVQFALRTPPATRFLLGAVSQAPDLMKTLSLDVQSVAGACGVPVDFVDVVDSGGNASSGLVSRLRVCDGGQATYQIAVGSGQPFHTFVTDLASAGSTTDLSGGAPATYKATRARLNLVLAPQDATFTVDGVVNGATFAPGIAPGGVVSIFGAGLGGGGSATSVDVDGVAATVLSATAFQVNAVVPPETAPGLHTLRVRSAFGAAQQTVMVATVAPGIFLIGSPPTGAVVNYPDGSINGPFAAALRGQALVIYATGLGQVAPSGGLSTAIVPVSVVINGQELPSSFAGLTPGYSGLYQVNVLIPPPIPPDLGASLTLKQGEQFSNKVMVSIQ